MNVFPSSSLVLLCPSSSISITCGLFAAVFLNVTLPPTATFTSTGCAALSLSIMTSSGPAGAATGVSGTAVSCGVVAGVSGAAGVVGVCDPGVVGVVAACFAHPTNNSIARIAIICIAFILKPPCLFIINN